MPTSADRFAPLSNQVITLVGIGGSCSTSLGNRDTQSVELRDTREDLKMQIKTSVRSLGKRISAISTEADNVAFGAR